MATSFQKVYVHFVFSTKYRKPIIKPEIEQRLWAYLGGIAREKGFPVLICGGMADHIHLLVPLSSTESISKTVQTLKGASSKWLNDNFFLNREFKWQAGYGAFSISQSGLEKAINYIKNQKEHHRKKTFKDEYLQLLKTYDIDYEEQYFFS